MKPGVATRVAAATMVGRIDRSGAWSNIITSGISAEDVDASFARHLVYGTTRHRARIDTAIAALSNRPLGSLTPDVLDVLRVAFHEVMFSRTPEHASADNAVEAARALGVTSASGFVNALVRRLVREGEPNVPDDLASRWSMPLWLVEEIESEWGAEAGEAFVRASNEDAERWVRVRPSEAKGSVGEVRKLGRSRPPSECVVQDPASVAVAEAVGAGPGDQVLEVGAAPGGKSLAMADAGADVTAADVHERRVNRAARRLPSLTWVVADGRCLPFASAAFDRVLVDAPCTGLGTLRRRPEIKYKATVAERDRLATLQRQLVAAAMDMVRPGGRLVYAVCTVTRAETIDVVAPFRARPPDGIDGHRSEHGVLMAPHITGTDGMFIATVDR